MAKDTIEKTLTFDEVLLVPQKSSVLPKEVDCSTFLTKNIKMPESYDEIKIVFESISN